MSGTVRHGLMLLVKGYRLLLSPWLGASCRFFPTCSAYALEALDSHGAAAGTYLTLRRIARCHPWCEGGVDFVPKEAPALWPSLPRVQPRTSPLATAAQEAHSATSLEKTLS